MRVKSAAPGRKRARAPSLPQVASIQATMLWMETKAETAGQASASASMTRTASRRVRPAPPCSSGTYIAARPRAPASARTARGIAPSASQSEAKGAMRSRPKSRAMARIATCSSERAKSISPPTG